MYTKEEVKEATLKYFNGDELATSAWMDKYAYKNLNGYHELTPNDMHKRLAKEFARIEEKYSWPRYSEEEIFDVLKDFKYIIPQGSPMFGIGNDEVLMSLSNCAVVKSPEDSITSIFNTGRDMAILYKNRYGCGVNLSNLRPEKAKVNNAAGTSTGAWSFANYYSEVTSTIGQNGRRGALMIGMHVKHPDIFQFVNMKKDLTKVTSANVSIQITDEFMRAVVADEDFTLQWPINSPNPSIVKTIRARDLWNQIIDAAWQSAEPGLLFWDRIISTLPAHLYPGFETLITNPCGEVPLSPDSCRLLSICLSHMIVNGQFDFTLFERIASIAMVLMDDLVDLEIEKLEKIIAKIDTQEEKDLFNTYLTSCKEGRRTGLGTTGLADLLAKLGLRYDSDEAIELISKIYETLRNISYATSTSLAKHRGAFPVFNWELEKDNEFIKNLPLAITNQMSRVGRRNISILTNAPTGTVSLMTQTSSGIEPIFRREYIRRKKVNDNSKADFTDLGINWQEFTVYHHAYEEAIKDKTKEEIEELKKIWVSSDEIDWQQRIKVQAAIQKNIDHSVSSTINLPNSVTKEEVSELYINAWKNGLKGVTIYRDGSRTGVLITKDSTKDKINYIDAPKRPVELPCDVHHVKVKGQNWIFLIGLLDGKPYEVFGGKADAFLLEKSVTKAKISKLSRKTKASRYDLILEDETKKDLVTLIDNDDYTTLSRLISMSLRHGVPLPYVVDQLLKDKNDTIVDFAPVLARVLKTYIQDGLKAKKACTQCGQTTLIYQEGCLICTSCGASKCG